MSGLFGYQGGVGGGGAGTPGADGATWLNGAIDPAANIGSNNDYYINTASYDIFQKQSGAWVKIGNLKGAAGATGATGTPGATWLNGTIDPTAGLGTNNDYYINTASYDIFQKQSGAWVKIGNLKGAAGATGATGPGVPAGGTTGQFLSKKSNTDYDTQWVAAPTGGGSTDGWNPVNATLSYSSSDAPNYVLSTGGVDLSNVIPLGARIRLYQTNAFKYGIVVAVNATTITIYGGTDYSIVNAAITNPYFSVAKAPFGFPLDPAKWSVVLTDSINRPISSPTVDTLYDTGLSITVPVGMWDFGYTALIRADKTSTGISGYVELSRSTTAETDLDTITGIIGYDHTAIVIGRRKIISLTEKTTFYMLMKTKTPDGLTTLAVRGDFAPTVISAVCAYL
jgi:hypothetical protein